MSHVCKLDVEIKDLQSLRKAAQQLGLYFREQSTYRWYGKSIGDYPLPEGFSEEELGKCNYAIGVPDSDTAYEVGVALKNGKVHLLWDFWQKGYGLQDAIGENGSKLKQEYAIAAATKEMIRKGFRVSRTVNQETGKPRIVARRMS